MKLYELHGYKKYLDKSLKSIVVGLIHKHSIKVKKGCFGVVVISPSKDYVYKLWQNDPAYDDWINYAKRNPQKHVIKVLSPIKSLPFKLKKNMNSIEETGEKPGRVNADGGMKYVKLEKLTPTVDYDLGRLIDAMRNGYRFNRDWTHEKFFNYLNEQADNFSLKKEAIEENKSFWEVYFEIAEAIMKLGHNADIHSDNVMMRGDDIVITDPASNWAAIGGEGAVTAPMLFDVLDIEARR